MLHCGHNDQLEWTYVMLGLFQVRALLHQVVGHVDCYDTTKKHEASSLF